MGHVQYLAAVADQPLSHVFDIETLEKSDPHRRVALPFARKLTRQPEKVDRADIDSLRTVFTEPQIVQLVFAICHFNTMNRLADAFGVPLEETNVFAKPKKPAEPGPAPSTAPPPSRASMPTVQASTP